MCETFGVVIDRTTGAVKRIINPDYLQQLDEHRLGAGEFMLRLSKPEFGVASGVDAMTPADVHRIVQTMSR